MMMIDDADGELNGYMWLLRKQAQSDDDEAGETVALNMAASGDKFMEEFFEQVWYFYTIAFIFFRVVSTEELSSQL